ncbi:Oocyte zinc finger protein XlCOF7.1 [Folsomia candida]|uniref:Oocyte zinc finger protein XlCOF7.1 n=1 Tax=Folsomia candida TaxID=158441 RepID=A0A226ESZ5_FOLCA|nr:Oocyte zinc finger protein XlCOF7.1 [Folsomia candida]
MSLGKRQDETLRYHTWNAGGHLNQENLEEMNDYWDGSNLVFVQETHLPPSEESALADYAKNFGWKVKFNSAVPYDGINGGWRDGVCVFYKNIKIRQIVLPRCKFDGLQPDPQRLMLIEAMSDLSTNPIFFFNMYFPACRNDAIRVREQERWLKIIDHFCDEYKNELVVWIGDFNCERLKSWNDKPNRKSYVFDSLEVILEKYGFLDVTDHLWEENVFTRHAPHFSNKVNHIVSMLDHVLISRGMQVYHQTCIPLYNGPLDLSDHVNIQCSNKVATAQFPAVPVVGKMVCDPPVIPRNHRREFSCICGYISIDRSNYGRHLKTCTGTTYTTVCELCNLDCGNRGQLVRHKTACTGGELKCTIGCEKIFRLQSELEWHEKFCNGIEGTVCPNCAKDFENKTSLRNHLRHTCNGPKNLTCPTCKKEFKYSSKLEEHYARNPSCRNGSLER